MIRTLKIAQTYLESVMKKRNVFLIFGMALAMTILALTSSSILGFSQIKDAASNPYCISSFYIAFINFSNLMCASVIMIINVTTISSLLNNNSEYMFLTGGVKRSQYIIGKNIGMVVFCVLCFAIVWGVNTIAVFVFKIGSFDRDVLVAGIGLMSNCILISEMAFLFLLLYNSIAFGIVPLVFYLLYQLYFNASIMTTKGSGVVYQVINALFPIFRQNGVSSMKELEITQPYKLSTRMSSYYGKYYFIAFCFLLIGAMVLRYRKKDL